MERKSYDAVDLAKWLCAWLVMYIHFAPVLTGCLVADRLISEGICSIAVPFFFAVSSFLLFRRMGDPKSQSRENNGRLRKFCKHILVLYTVWAVVYVAYDVFIRYYNHIDHASPAQYIKDFFLRGSRIHLWYLLSSVYAIPVVYLLMRRGRSVLVAACVIGGLLQFADLMCNWEWIHYAIVETLRDDYLAVYRTIVFAIPLMCLGVLCMEDYSKKKSRQWLVRLLLAGLIYIVEMMIAYGLHGVQMKVEILLSGPMVVYYLVNWLFTLDFRLPVKWLGKALRLNSTWIYCAHILVVMLYEWVFAYQGIVRYFLVGGLTVVSGIPYVVVKMLSRNQIRRRQ